MFDFADIISYICFGAPAIVERVFRRGDRVYDLETELMEETVITSRIENLDFNDFRSSGLTVTLTDLVDGYKKAADGTNVKTQVDRLYLNLEAFKVACCNWNRDFYLYLVSNLKMGSAKSVLPKICKGAEITLKRKESFDKYGVGCGYSTLIEKVILLDPNPELQKLKEELRAKYDSSPPINYKETVEEYERILRDNDVDCFYHVTDKRNCASIKRHGGLFSWFYCEMNDLKIPFQGGNETSRTNDVLHGLHDYVRLSFCSDHPMCARLREEGAELVVLKIDPRVALWRDTLFSDMNATDKDHVHGGDLEMLKKINFAATRRTYVRSDDPEFKQHQAEVLVKTHIPLEYILNGDELEALVAHDSEKAEKDVVYSE